MVRKKRVISGGIAFSEKQDLKTLRNYAAKGWIVKRYKGMGYELEEGPAEDVIFSIDVNLVKGAEYDEYMDMMRAGGWEHVASSSTGTHLFKAAPGTPPIYTDKESEAGKLERMLASIVPASLICFVALVVSAFGRMFTSGMLEQLFNGIFGIAIALSAPCVMMLISLTIRKKRMLSKV